MLRLILQDRVTPPTISQGRPASRLLCFGTSAVEQTFSIGKLLTGQLQTMSKDRLLPEIPKLAIFLLTKFLN